MLSISCDHGLVDLAPSETNSVSVPDDNNSNQGDRSFKNLINSLTRSADFSMIFSNGIRQTKTVLRLSRQEEYSSPTSS